MPTATILITGAAGNLGGKLAAHFRAADHALVLLDKEPGIHPGIETADLSRWDRWTDRFKGVDCVIHLAADSRVEARWASVARNNIAATCNVIEAAARHGVKRVVFASSTWVMEGYGKSTELITEDLEPRPINAYGSSKLSGECIGRSFNQARGLSVVCFRIGVCPPAPYDRAGPHIGPSLWIQRKWLSSGDLCRAFDSAINPAVEIEFEVFNLMSNNRGMRWDMGKAERLLGFRPIDASIPELGHLSTRIRRRVKKFLRRKKPDLGPRIRE